jgi:RNA polymerase sigma-70 factor (ECF subfamily)
MGAEEHDLAAVYDQHADALFAFLLNLTRSEAETKDLLQDLFVRLARKPSLLASARNERSFLLKTAHNLFIDHCRRNGARTRNHLRAAEETEAFFLADPSGPPSREVEAALRALPAEQRAVLHLKVWEEKTFQEIAHTLGISPNTAASRYRYAVDKLRGLLRPSSG